MEKLKVFLLISLLLAFTSCKKLEHQDTSVYIISGYLYDDCGMAPSKNQQISLFQTLEISPFNNTDGGELAVTTADNNGYFKFEYKDGGGGTMIIRYKAGAGYNSIMEEIPVKLNKEDLMVYKNPTTNIQVRLNVVNPHSVNDTLILNDLRGNYNDTILGPFISGTIYTATDYNLLVQKYNGEDKVINWYLRALGNINQTANYKINVYCSDTVIAEITVN